MSISTSLLIAIERARRAAVRSGKLDVIEAIARDLDVNAGFEKLRRELVGQILRETMRNEMMRAISAMKTGDDWQPPENVGQLADEQGKAAALRMVADAIRQVCL